MSDIDMENKQKKNSHGRFIVFEGIDGSGKSSLMRSLAKRLEREGRKVICTAEPSHSAVGKFLRSVLAGELKKSEDEMAALFALDRIYHNTEISEYLCRGYDVICDRYYYSSLAYQGSETDIETVKRFNLDRPEIRTPDICIYVDVEPEVSLKRILTRNEPIEIYETKEKLERVRRRFFEVFEMLKCEGYADNIAVVDNSGELKTAEEAVWANTERLFR